MKLINNNFGQSLIEIVAATAVISVGILAIAKITIKSIGNTTFARNRAVATKYAQESMEEVRNLRDSQSTTFFQNNSCDNSQTLGIFTRVRDCSLSTDAAGRQTMAVVVTVVWSDAAGTHQSRIQTDLTSWK
jgi:Tfp pilus assembly protein PilV